MYENTHSSLFHFQLTGKNSGISKVGSSVICTSSSGLYHCSLGAKSRCNYEELQHLFASPQVKIHAIWFIRNTVKINTVMFLG